MIMNEIATLSIKAIDEQRGPGYRLADDEYIVAAVLGYVEHATVWFG